MLEHQQSHTDNYRFRCSTCNKGFTRQSYYRDHKCPAAGNGTEAKGGAGEEEGDEAAGEPTAEEQEGEHDRRRTSQRPQTAADDAEEGRQQDEEEEEEGTDEGCHTAIATIKGQIDEEEEHGREDDDGEVLQIQSKDRNSLQQSCL